MILVNEDCFGMWLRLWSPCTQGRSFDLSLARAAGHYSHPVPCDGSTCSNTVSENIFQKDGKCMRNSVNGEIACAGCYVRKSGQYQGQCVQDNSVPLRIRTIITKHEDICRPVYVADGRCPRGLISNLGDLYVRELVASASISPLMTLLRVTPQAETAKSWIARSIFRKRDHQTSVAVDKFVFSVVLSMEIPLVLGFCYPILVPLACLVVGLNTGVFRVAVACLHIELKETATRVSVKYLWGSLTIGCAIIVWLFVESDLHGKWLVIIGVPLVLVGSLSAVACRMLIWHRTMRLRTVARSSLRAPLLDASQNTELVTMGVQDRSTAGDGECVMLDSRSG